MLQVLKKGWVRPISMQKEFEWDNNGETLGDVADAIVEMGRVRY